MQPMTSRVFLRATLATVALAAGGLSAAPAAAQALGYKYWGEISGYYASVDTRANVSRPGRPGTDIDMEHDLGLNKHETLPDVLVGGKFFKRWFVVGEFFALDRNGSRVIDRDLVFDGVTYPARGEINSKFRSDIYRLSVGYNFIQRDNAELGVVLGLHATDFKVQLEGNSSLGTSTSVTLERRAKDFVAPLPTVGLAGAVEVYPKVILSGRADYLSLKVGDYDGSILNAQAGIGYRINDTFEVGAGWRYVDYSLDVEKEAYTAKVDYDFSGPSIYLRAGFR